MQLQNRQPNSGTKSMYSTWIAQNLLPVTEKIVASFKDQREYVAMSRCGAMSQVKIYANQEEFQEFNLPPNNHYT